MGIKVSRLLGGIRAYRRWVTHILEHPPSVPQCIVISGYTGTGKTQILRRLFEKGYPVLDLEQMAQHRGSIFGHIHLNPHNQKTFDALLVEHLIDHQHAPYIIIEAESRRIGKVLMPEFLCHAKQQGYVIHMDMPIEQRVHYILEDYRPTENHEAYIQAISHIKKRIQPSVATQILDSIHQQSYETAVQLLLEHYYDPRYHHASWKYQDDPIYCQVANADDAIEQIEQLISQRFPINQ